MKAKKIITAALLVLGAILPVYAIDLGNGHTVDVFSATLDQDLSDIPAGGATGRWTIGGRSLAVMPTIINKIAAGDTLTDAEDSSFCICVAAALRVNNELTALATGNASELTPEIIHQWLIANRMDTIRVSQNYARYTLAENDNVSFNIDTVSFVGYNLDGSPLICNQLDPEGGISIAQILNAYSQYKDSMSSYVLK